ncbi:IS630 family transposase [Hoyosella subflava]|uniref:Putative IS630 family ISPsy1-like transposase n=1 Tax=Hoyosella subflava (strain DSM 45089 / JCM 17490 / NBRC 109087 / DQS3-9A1) TaxID=443218 RepID=F6ELE6_HOYSD|nr:IS630 family transposase [Hoyosella subflava]AEF39238.1 Putative IS630 family ISPsy1-like transposase [Hoyosella subflava DQS3-9A1]
MTSDPTAGGAVAEPVRVRRLTDHEGQKLQQIVRRDSTSSVRYRRPMMLLASAGGNRVPVIAQLVQADEDTVRDVIHAFNEKGLACLDPRWAGGRPRQLKSDEEDFVVQTATTRPVKLGQPFTRWSLRKLVAYLRKVHGRVIRISREALRCLLARRGVTFQRTKTWKESPDPERETKLDRIEHVLDRFPDRAFAFDEFGPLGIRPIGGSCWAERTRPDRLPATYRRTHGVRYFHGCYSVGDDRLWGVNRRKKGAGNTLAALKSIRAARPDGAPIYVILDNLSAHKHKGADIRRWAKKHKGRAVLHPDLRLLGEPDRGALRTTAAVHHRQLPPPQPHCPDQGPALLPPLAQRQCLPPRRPVRRTQGTRPHPQRERRPMGRTPPHNRSLIQPGVPTRSQH